MNGDNTMSNTQPTTAEIAVETLLAVKEFEEVTLKDISRISKALKIEPTELFAELDKNTPRRGFVV